MTEAERQLTSERREVLEAFSRALDREAHNLGQWPHPIWQELYNHLQWEKESIPSVLAREMTGRFARGGPPWLRLRTPIRESQFLMHTLTGHTAWVEACAVSPDGAFIVSAGADKTLKVWDAATGRERASLSLLGPGTCVAAHPTRTTAAGGDAGGNFYIADSVRIEYGPFIVTVVDLWGGPTVGCPACSQQSPIGMDRLRQQVACPRPSCDGRMRVNPFVIRMRSTTPPKRSARWPWQWFRRHYTHDSTS